MDGLLFALIITTKERVCIMDRKIALAYLNGTTVPICELPPELQDAKYDKVREWLTTQAYPLEAK